MSNLKPSIVFQLATAQEEPADTLTEYTHKNGAMVVSVLSSLEKTSKDIAEMVQETLEFAGGHGGQHLAKNFIQQARTHGEFLAIRVEQNTPHFSQRPIDLSETTGCHNCFEL